MDTQDRREEQPITPPASTAPVLASAAPAHARPAHHGQGHAPAHGSAHGHGGHKKAGGHHRKPQRHMSRGPMPKTVTDPNKKNETMTLPPIGENIRIIPLGGMEEIGRNMSAVEYKGDIIVIDAGIQFSTDETPGIDYILPNTRYLEENKDRIVALVITHGHLDHIGAIPFIIDRIGNPPIYTREFGALLIKKRHVEFPHLPPLNLKIVEKSDGALPLGKHMKVRFFGLTHAIPDSTGVIIETPLGDIVATGDVRVDNIENVPTEKEHQQYAIFKGRNVLLLMMDSTGIDKPGWCISEDIIIRNIDKIVADVPGRIMIATFASQVERIIEFIKMSAKYNKKVVVEGRSMKNNVEIIKFLNLTNTDHVISIEEMEKYPPHKLMILATGAQGEEFAALMRMSNRSHKQLRLNKTDTIILSSSVIPGNDRAVDRLKDNLYRHDAKIITYLDSDVHTSGHGKRGELEWIHHQIPYRFFMPVHGSHYKLKMHAELAREIVGTPAANIVVAENSSIVEISEGGHKIAILKEKVPEGKIMVDGFAIGDIQEVVIRDRQMLSSDGMFVIVAIVNSTTGKLRKSPDIISRGFVYLRESQELLRQTRFLVKDSIEKTAAGQNPIDFDGVKVVVTDAVSKYLFQQTAKRPIVIPVILAV